MFEYRYDTLGRIYRQFADLNIDGNQESSVFFKETTQACLSEIASFNPQVQTQMLLERFRTNSSYVVQPMATKLAKNEEDEEGYTIKPEFIDPFKMSDDTDELGSGKIHIQLTDAVDNGDINKLEKLTQMVNRMETNGLMLTGFGNF
jgi:hypothetical protein